MGLGERRLHLAQRLARVVAGLPGGGEPAGGGQDLLAQGVEARLSLALGGGGEKRAGQGEAQHQARHQAARRGAARRHALAFRTPAHSASSSTRPVISSGTGWSIMVSRVGAMSHSRPSSSRRTGRGPT